VQFQLFLLYQAVFFIPVIIHIWIRNRKIFTWKNYAVSLGSLLVLSSFFVAEIKFNFQQSKALVGFLLNHNSSSNSLFEKIIKFYNSLVNNISYNITGGNIVFATLILFILGAALVFLYKKNKDERLQIVFLSIWALSALIIYPLEKNNAYFLNVGNTFPLLILVSYVIYKISTQFSYAIYLIPFFIGMVNIPTIISMTKLGDPLFSVQKGVLLSDAKELVDYTYVSSNYKNFAIDSVTNPLFINTTWSYIYNSYGLKKYSSMPVWAGYPQDAQFGEEIVYNHAPFKTLSYLYLIIEPGPGIPLEYIKGFKRFEDTRSQLIETKKFWNYTVEKRQITSDKSFSRDEVFQFSLKK
jgi:hypothetical protein